MTLIDTKEVNVLERIVRVYRPILTEEERERRMEAIKKAAVDLVIAAERANQNKSRSFNE